MHPNNEHWPISVLYALQQWAQKHPEEWGAQTQYFAQYNNGGRQIWSLPQRIIATVVPSIKILDAILNKAYAMLEVLGPVATYAIDPQSKAKKALTQAPLQSALKMADMMYKGRVTKALDHFLALIALHKGNQAIPPLPLLPPPSRANTPAYLDHLVNVWTNGYNGYLATEVDH